MGAAFGYPAAVKHYYPVGVNNRAKPVGYHHNRFTLGKCGERFLHKHLVFGVERSGNVINLKPPWNV